MLDVDLRAFTIPNEQRVWRLFPGSGYKFLDGFVEHRLAFLDFPGLVLPNGNLAEAKDLVPRIVRSQAVADAHRAMGANAKIDLPLEQFKDARITQNRGRLRQALVSFFQEAKAGDFVVAPEPVFMSRIWLGRFTGDERTVGYHARYGRSAIPARAVQWLGKVAENSVSAALSQSLRHQHPFTLLEKSLFVEAFSLSYGSFVFGDRHAATIYNDKGDFLDADAAFLGAISRLSAAACQAVDEGRANLKGTDFLDLLVRTPPIEYTCTQEADIHSPGFNRYISATPVSLVIAAVCAALLGYSQLGSKQELAKELPQLSFSNSAPNADPACTAQVSQASKMVLAALDIEKTWALCEAARAAAGRAGLRSSARPKKK